MLMILWKVRGRGLLLNLLHSLAPKGDLISLLRRNHVEVEVEVGHAVDLFRDVPLWIPVYPKVIVRDLLFYLRRQVHKKFLRGAAQRDFGCVPIIV